MPPVASTKSWTDYNAGSAAANVAPRKIDIRNRLEGLQRSFRLLASSLSEIDDLTLVRIPRRADRPTIKIILVLGRGKLGAPPRRRMIPSYLAGLDKVRAAKIGGCAPGQWINT